MHSYKFQDVNIRNQKRSFFKSINRWNGWVKLLLRWWWKYFYNFWYYQNVLHALAFTLALIQEIIRLNCQFQCGKFHQKTIKHHLKFSSLIWWNASPFSCSQNRFPFDSKNPIGFLFAIILEYIVYGYYFFVISCNVAVGVGAFWLAISASVEIQRILYLINDKSQVKQHHYSNELKTLCSECIHFHGIVEQLSIFKCIKTLTYFLDC